MMPNRSTVFSAIFALFALLLLFTVNVNAQDTPPTPTPLPPEPLPDCPALRGEPDDIRVGYYMGQGIAYRNAGELINAKLSFACIVEIIDPTYVPAWMGRAEIYFRLREYLRAQYDYNTALQYQPGLIAALNNRGVVFAAQRDYARAGADFQAAMDADPDYLTAYNNRAIIYVLQGDYEAAITLIEATIQRTGIEGVIAQYRDPNRPDDAEPIPFDPLAARMYALLGIIYERRALSQYDQYTYLYAESGRRADQRITAAAGAIESRFTFDLRLDDGTWLLMEDYLP